MQWRFIVGLMDFVVWFMVLTWTLSSTRISCLAMSNTEKQQAATAEVEDDDEPDEWYDLVLTWADLMSSS